MEEVTNVFAASLWSIMPWIIGAILIGSLLGLIVYFLNRNFEKFLRNLKKRNKY